jgi:hypothetical protein
MLNYHDEGIWFEEEDPTSEYYRPECCTNVYLDCAKGKFDYNYIKNCHEDDDDYYDYYDYYLDNF